MKYLDLTFDTPERNLACDEALLDHCEEGLGDEVLRFWEPHEHFIVLGYSNKMRTEINELSCRRSGVAVLRRTSGGGAVLQGPGCLNYSLVLQINGSRPVGGIAETNAYVLACHRTALAPVLGNTPSFEGPSDLALGGLKFSGNAQRRKSKWLLFHGTFLLRLDLARVEELLRVPSRQPAYRRDRPHRAFLKNLGIPAAIVKTALRDAWQAGESLASVPREKIETLVRERYARADWNLKY